MKEQIKQIRKHAEYTVRTTGASGTKEELTDVDDERFAELIIGECINAIVGRINITSDEKIRNELRILVDDILTRFGAK